MYFLLSGFLTRRLEKHCVYVSCPSPYTMQTGEQENYIILKTKMERVRLKITISFIMTSYSLVSGYQCLHPCGFDLPSDF
jgi:hypothetical protein